MKNKSLIIAVCSAIVILLAGCGEQTAGTPAGAGSSSAEISAPAEDIGLEAAKAAAVKHAGVSASEAEFTKAKLDYDDGVAEYDIEFTINSAEYEYEIRASDGKVLEFSKEGDPDAEPTGLISESIAKEIALTNAGFSASQVSFKKCELDYDDGITKYEVEFTVNGTEYEFEINANTGAILEMDVDHDDDHHDDHH